MCTIPDWTSLPLRQAIGDPFDPQRLLLSPGISTLTIRRDRAGGRHWFVLHERDGGKVADGGGLCRVMPAGEFQPSSVDLAGIRNDFSLWHNIMREFSEEFLGNPNTTARHPAPSTTPRMNRSERSSGHGPRAGFASGTTAWCWSPWNSARSS